MTDLVEKISGVLFAAFGRSESRVVAKAVIMAIQDNGYAIVPMEATEDMARSALDKIVFNPRTLKTAYRHMIAAAPPIGDEG